MDWRSILFHSGDLFLPKPVKEFLEQYWIGDDNSLFYVTWWTFIHFMSGILTGLFLLQYKNNYYLHGFALHTLWEFWQILGKNTPYWTLRGRIDIVTDTIAFMIGLVFIRAL
jgi:hypothetical protein